MKPIISPYLKGTDFDHGAGLLYECLLYARKPGHTNPCVVLLRSKNGNNPYHWAIVSNGRLLEGFEATFDAAKDKLDRRMNATYTQVSQERFNKLELIA